MKEIEKKWICGLERIMGRDNVEMTWRKLNISKETEGVYLDEA